MELWCNATDLVIPRSMDLISLVRKSVVPNRDEWKLLGNQWFLIRGAGNFDQIVSRGDKCVIEEEIWSQIVVSQFILYNQTQKFPSCLIPKFSIWHHYNEHAFKIIKRGGNTTKTKERSWAWCHDPHLGWNSMNLSSKRNNVWLSKPALKEFSDPIKYHKKYMKVL